MNDAMRQSDAAPRRGMIHALLLGATAACYAQVLGFDFVVYDDMAFVFDNPMVKKGLTIEGLAWAMGTSNPAGWNPLAWLSHMLDWMLFADWAGGHHAVSVLLHLASVSLLFEWLRRATGAVWPSAIVAGLFAIHPHNVESVAWIAERRDVLCVFWVLVTLHCYLHYVRQPSPGRYAWTTAAFALALLSKPLAVTLPCAMLLLDVWPLNRIKQIDRTMIRRRILEKLPWLGLSAVSSVMNVITQRQLGAALDYEAFTFAERVGNALISYATYMIKLAAPTNLAVPYLLPVTISPLQVAGSFVLLAAVTLIVVRHRLGSPWLLIGWLWYLGILFPMCGLFQVGLQARADRYGYLPFVGLFIAIVWGAADAIGRAGVRRRVVVSGLVLVFVVLWLLSFIQIGYWRNSLMLFRHSVAIQHENHVARQNLGYALLIQGGPGNIDEAIEHFQSAAHISPTWFEAHFSAGQALLVRDRAGEAAGHLARAVELRPDNRDANLLLGRALAMAGQLDRAAGFMNRAIEIDENFAIAHYDRALLAQQRGKRDVALHHFAQVVRLDPSHDEARSRLKALSAQSPDAR